MNRASAVARAAAVSAYMRKEGIPVQSGRRISDEGVKVSHGGVFPGSALAVVTVDFVQRPTVERRMVAAVRDVLDTKYSVRVSGLDGTMFYVYPKED